MTTDLDLIHDCQTIGGIAEMAAWATDEFTELIADNGVPLHLLTVGELLHLIQTFKARHAVEENP